MVGVEKTSIPARLGFQAAAHLAAVLPRAEAAAVEEDEATFIAEALERTDTLLLLDVSNLHHVSSERVIARRGFSFGAALLKQSLRFTIAIRLPLLGERWISLPLKIL